MAKQIACTDDVFQAVRIFDVFLLGPVMIQAGRKIGGPMGTFLAISGVGTIIFNALNFIDIEKENT